MEALIFILSIFIVMSSVVLFERNMDKSDKKTWPDGTVMNPETVKKLDKLKYDFLYCVCKKCVENQDKRLGTNKADFPQPPNPEDIPVMNIDEMYERLWGHHD